MVETAINGPVKQQIIWRNVILIVTFHTLALYGAFVGLLKAELLTQIWCIALCFVSGFGVTGGAHRLWTHRSYKANTPLRIILAACYLMAGMNPLFEWVRDHRVHHKFSETDADPHNAKRGLFFSHVGWLMQRKHPEVLRQGREVDMSDILADPVVVFQQKYFIVLQFMMCFAIPISIPCLFWEETWWNSTFSTIFRWVFSMNCVWAVNSFAHLYGNHPYNREINPAENLMVSLFAMGEGWHNYHHTFPWDYKTSELGFYGYNFTTAIIDFFAYIGWAYDLKQPSKELVKKTVQKIGDGTHIPWGISNETPTAN